MYHDLKSEMEMEWYNHFKIGRKFLCYLNVSGIWVSGIQILTVFATFLGPSAKIYNQMSSAV